MISAARREEIIGALRRGTVPVAGLDVLAVGIDTLAPSLDAELAAVAAGRAGFKAVRGESGRSVREPAALRPARSRSTRPRRRCTVSRRCTGVSSND